MCLMHEAVESLDPTRSAVGTGMWQMGPGRTSAQRSTQEQVSTGKGKLCFFKFVSRTRGKLCADVSEREAKQH